MVRRKHSGGLLTGTGWLVLIGLVAVCIGLGWFGCQWLLSDNGSTKSVEAKETKQVAMKSQTDNKTPARTEDADAAVATNKSQKSAAVVEVKPAPDDDKYDEMVTGSSYTILIKNPNLRSM